MYIRVRTYYPMRFTMSRVSQFPAARAAISPDRFNVKIWILNTGGGRVAADVNRRDGPLAGEIRPAFNRRAGRPASNGSLLGLLFCWGRENLIRGRTLTHSRGSRTEEGSGRGERGEVGTGPYRKQGGKTEYKKDSKNLG